MSRILVLYGTTDGHTAKVAGAAALTLAKAGCRVDVADASNLRRDIRARDYDAVIVAASVHASGYQRGVRRWVRHNAADLAKRPNAFLSVCMGVVEGKPAVDAALARIAANFARETGWRAERVKMVAGALPWTRYSLLKRWAMRRIVAKTGVASDTSRDYEYTDWDDLEKFTLDFARSHELTGGVSAPVPVLESASCSCCRVYD